MDGPGADSDRGSDVIVDPVDPIYYNGSTAIVASAGRSKSLVSRAKGTLGKVKSWLKGSSDGSPFDGQKKESGIGSMSINMSTKSSVSSPASQVGFSPSQLQMLQIEDCRSRNLPPQARQRHQENVDDM